MELITTYPAAVNSKATVTMGVLDQATTIVEVLDATVLPEAPNLLVLGTDQTAETVLMTAKENNTLTIQRAVQGIAKSWPAGTQIARNFTGKDWDDMRSNVEALFNELVSLIVDGVVPVDKGGTGATERFSALANLFAVGSMGVVGDGYSSLGEIITNGVYQVYKVYPDSPPNTSQYAILTVFEANGYVRQVYQSTNDTDNRKYCVRTRSEDGTWGAWIELADASKVLSLTGGTLSGTLNFFADRGSVGTEYDTSVTSTYLRSLFGDESYLIDVSNYGIRYFKGTKEDKFKNSYSIFGEHNKPSGSYTGNGSATSRTITVGGIGNLLITYSANGSAFITRLGAIILSSGTMKALTYSEAHYQDGILTLATTDSVINANSISVYYEAK